MYLRRLEIQGFKSFASRSVFDFGPGITAIVGPNGCGKSNLSDALRWVLGEQSPRALRVRRAEDVIFAGGRQRPPAGFAEVSITLSNAEHWLPVEFEEVVVTRRLHRSGESEYLVNRARVRLRDVVDLFARARLGQNSYAIMSQGLVDAVLTLSPHERRALIEEAASVRHHRASITDAAQRLAATRENLERVGLLVAELAPRLQQLSVQARRSREYAQLTVDLGDALASLFGWQKYERAAALVGSQAAYEQRRAELVAAKAGAERTKAELDAVHAELERERGRAERAAAAVRDLDARGRDAEQRLHLLAEREQVLEARLRELAQDIDALREERDALSMDEPDDAPERTDADALEGALLTTQAELRSAEAEFAQSQQQRQQVERNLHQLEAQAAIAEGTLRGVRQRLETWQRDAQQVTERRTAMLTRLRRQAVDFQRLTAESRTVAGDLTSTMVEHTAGASAAVEAVLQAEQAEGGLLQITTQIAEAMSRLQMLERLQQEQQGDSAVKALLDASKQAGKARAPRVLALLHDAIHVEKRFEVAVAAVLADQVRTVIVPERADLEAAMSVLDRQAVGRASIASLPDIRPPLRANLCDGQGIVGIAAQLVECDPSVRPLVDALLGATVVVHDFESAWTAVGRGFGAAVTVDGVLVRADGVVVAGQSAAHEAVFGRRHEIDELARRHGLLQAGRAGAAEAAMAARSRAKAAESRVRELAGGAESLRIRQTHLLAEAATVRDAIGTAKVESRRLRDGAQTFSIRRDGLAAELVQAEQHRESITDSTKRAQSARDERHRESETLRRSVEDCRAKLTNARSARQALEAHRAMVTRLRQSRQAAVDRVERSLLARESEVVERRLEGAALERERREVVDAASQLQAATALERQRLAPLQARVEALAKHDRELGEQADRRQPELLHRERAVLEAETAVTRAADALAQIEAEIESEAVSVTPSGLELIELDDGPSQLANSHNGNHASEDKLPAESVTEKIDGLQARVRSLRNRVRQLGPINAEAERDYDETDARHTFLTSQSADLRGAEEALQAAIVELQDLIGDRFSDTFEAVNVSFARYFTAFFGGGHASLILTEPGVQAENGVDVLAQPPGKRQQHLQSLSGGERAMTAVALLFALLQASPAPFCVLDEVDAALDEANVARFAQSLQDLGANTQFVVITHNRQTMQYASTLYGISMGGDGVSDVLSLRLEDVEVEESVA